MTTSEVINILAQTVRADTSIVCSLGRTSDEAFDHFPSQSLFLDSMGDVVPLACGVALALKTHPVIALETDGGQLLGLASLPVVGSLKHRLSNLLVVIFDNQVYESAGNMPSRYCQLDWSCLGKAVDLNISTICNREDLLMALSSAFVDLTFLVIKIENADSPPPARKTLDGIESRYRFIRHLERLTGHELIHPNVKS